MEIALRCLILLILIFNFTLIMFDINKNQTIKQTAFETIRAANQNGLLELQENYDNFEVLDSAMMLNEWLVSFISNNSLDFQDVTIGFVEIESEPPFYVVRFEGYYDDYAIISKEAYVEYTNAAMIVSDNDIDEKE